MEWHVATTDKGLDNPANSVPTPEGGGLPSRHRVGVTRLDRQALPLAAGRCPSIACWTMAVQRL
jgi:hypothetical protein